MLPSSPIIVLLSKIIHSGLSFSIWPRAACEAMWPAREAMNVLRLVIGQIRMLSGIHDRAGDEIIEAE